jgi:uncharacterized protein YcaQ
MTATLARLRRYAVARSLFPPDTLQHALDRMGFVQADPIRAPARAQDLTLRHRVIGYHAGDLERLYASLDVEEDFFVNYGFLARGVWRLLHPRRRMEPLSRSGRKRVEALLAFIDERGVVHPRDVDRHFAHGSVTNYWGGSSSATTHLLSEMHYRGLVRVAARERGVRLYAVHRHEPEPVPPETARGRLDALIDVLVRTYAPVPSATLTWLVNRLRLGAPQWTADLKPALSRARGRLSRARVDGGDWFWPSGETHDVPAPDGEARLVAPFDPLVWDRRRFDLFWGWTYRFEAYTPAPRRRLGYYALPLLWKDQVIGWGNLSFEAGRLQADIGYAAGRAPVTRVFRAALERELARLTRFLK